MNSLLRLAYEGTARLVRGAAFLAPPSSAKILRALRARWGISARYAAWAATHRRPQSPLLWMHAPSVGEGLQARPVLALLRSARPDLQLAYTFFSPSAEPFARTLDVDFRDYLPFDTVADARAALDALRPRALVFSKLDLWPTLVREASARGVRLGLVSGTLAAASGRRTRLASALLHDAYARLDAVGAIDAADAERLVQLGVRDSVISVTGDTRYDQVWDRARGLDPRSALLAPLRSSRPTLVAGSTWPADEASLLEAWLAVRRTHRRARLIIAPHEPTPAHLAPIERWAAASGVALARLATVGADDADIVLVDRVGVLGDLYALASVAYVGGGFHSAGLHSVLEPAAFGAPVLFGPRYGASRDACLLRDAGGGEPASSPAEIAARLSRWFEDDGARAASGVRARHLVERGLGAAARSAALVERLLDG